MKDWWYGPLPLSLACMGREREEEKGLEGQEKSERGIRRKAHKQVSGPQHTA
jgi:hypothetical protein